MPSRLTVSPSKSNSIEHDRLFADHPAVVPRLDRDDLRRLVLDDAAVGVFDVNLAAREESDVGMHAQLGADDRLHVHRPVESRRVDHPLDARGAGAADFELHMAEIAAGGTLAPARRARRRRARGAPSRRFFVDVFFAGFAALRTFLLIAFFFAIGSSLSCRTADANMSARASMRWRSECSVA